jgi:hypothetical protein
VSQSDPTDHALATIASILDHPGSHREPEKAEVEEKPVTSGRVEADGYSKIGPGPMDAIRFRWIARREGNDQYFVDETVGENSRPISSGPMSAEAAIKLIDDREGEARRRFEMLKSEMAGRDAAANRKDGSEV